SLKVPKAPVSLLGKTIAIFKGKPDTEAILTIVYDHRRKSHRLVWVDQTTSRSRVHYDSITEDEGLTVYAEIHSHNSMEAFFSPIDDGSEARSTGLYGVIGRVDLDRPHALFRYSCGHHFRRIPAMSLFDDPKRVNELLVEAVQ
ncbi:MAG: Mov34/MPN/PAD-1 family protein, partial [Rubrobacter sp.]|nr:Mov34/MPN/PAD-1 family protein [Rubrobacter sp.]